MFPEGVAWIVYLIFVLQVFLKRFSMCWGGAVGRGTTYGLEAVEVLKTESDDIMAS